MKPWMKGAALWTALVCAVFGTMHAYAEYRSSRVGSSKSSSGDTAFEDAVDLDRFRKGNPEWDGQQLMVSGMTALHQEHQKILKELEEIKSAIRQLTESVQQ